MSKKTKSRKPRSNDTAADAVSLEHGEPAPRTPGLQAYRLWAREHGRLLSTELRVLFEALPDLNGIDYRPIRQTALATSLNLSQSRVSAALADLTQEQYLEPGPKDGTENRYRLNLTHVAIEQMIADHKKDD